MSAPFRVQVFGKAGCDKCKVLNRRLDTLLADSQWQDFEKVYFDVETEDGLVAFCRAECINPQRIPAFVVQRRESADEGDRCCYVPNPNPGAEDKVCKDAGLYTWLGLQTDYAGPGGGVITPKMIKAVLSRARDSVA
jgi:hypothetical protein